MDYSKLLYNLNYTKETGNGAGLDTAIQMIQDEIYKTEAKNAGRGSALSAAKKILKNSNIDNLYYPVYNDNGEQYFCDSYQLVKIYTPLPLENRPKDIPPFEYKTLDKLLGYAAENKKTVDLPSISALKAELKIQKGKPKNKKYRVYTFDFGEGLPIVNLEYLINILTLLPNCKTVRISEYKPMTTALYFCDDDNGIGLLMPLRKD